MRRPLAAGAVVLLLTRPAGAQPPGTPADTARPTPAELRQALDSLAARLARTEAALALLRQQLAEQGETSVRTRSRAEGELYAQLLANAFYTSARVNSVDVPQVVLPPGAPPPGGAGVAGASVRQTRLGGTASVRDVLGGTFDAAVDLDLFGGVASGPGDRRLFPEPRLRVWRARLVWARTELLVGNETPLVSDLDPVSVASVGVPDFSGAGNLWNWLPQLRVTRELGAASPEGSAPRRVRWAVQGALLAPVATAVLPGEPDAVDAAERARRPFVQGRVRARWGAAAAEHDLPALGALLDGGGEVGVGVHRGWVTTGGGAVPVRRAASRAVTLDARVALARGLELRGEGYAGAQLVRGLGGGAIAQTFGQPPVGAPAGTPGAPLQDAAAWGQLNWRATPALVAGAGCGVNAVALRGRPVRERNTVCATHLAWRPVEPLLVGFEYRQLRTRYASGTHRGHHLNLAFGVEL